MRRGLLRRGLLVAALVLVPLVELYLIIQVGQVVGALPTVVLLVGVSLLGAALLRREGSRTWQAFATAVQHGGVPAREVADGFLVLLAGALLLTPGFASDVVGLLLLLPPVRALLRARLTAYAGRRLLRAAGPGRVRPGGAGGWGAGPGGPGPGSRPGPGAAGPGGRGSGRVVDGEVVEGEGVDEP